MTRSDLWGVIKQTYNDWSDDKASRLAAALAYYAVFSLAPILVIAVSIAGIVLQNNEQARSQVVAQMSQLVSGMDERQADEWIQNAGSTGGAWWATIISFVILIWSASNVFAELQDSMNTIWEVKPRPDAGWWAWFRKRFLSVAMVFGIVFLLLVSLVVSTLITGFADTMLGWIGLGGTQGWVGRTVGIIVDVIVSLGVITLLFAAIFRYLPDVKIAWRDVWVGALVTAVLFTVGRYLLTVYFTFASPASAFGAAGSLVALLLWVYYSASILFFGAEFTQVWTRRHGGHIEPDEHAVRMEDEVRARRGMLPKHTDEGSAAQPGPQQGYPGQQGPQVGFPPPQRQPGRQPDHRARAAAAGSPPAYVERPVPVFVPVADTRGAKAIAAGGVVAGLTVGTLGILGRKLFSRRFDETEVARRLTEAESELARERGHRRYNGPGIRTRLDEVEGRILDVARRIPPPRKLETPHAGQINARLDELEHHFARDRGLERYAEHVGRHERIDRIEDRIRKVVREERRRSSPLPVWLQRVQEMVTGT